MDATARPNIVFVFADDWGWGDLGCYGHNKIKTPNLDRLASEGVLFTQFYVASGVCSPSRAAVVSGQFPARFGIHGHFADHPVNARRGMPNWLAPQVPTYMHALRQQGYTVGHYGKWHMGHGVGAPEPFAYGIDECRVNAGNGPQLPFPDVLDDEPGASFQDRSKDRFETSPRSQSSRTIIDESIAFIERHASAPFIVNVWLNDTHATLDPDPEMLERYEHLMPGGVKHKHVGAPAIYASVVTEADRHVGRLLDRLDDLDLSENTIVIFSADNGPEDIEIRNVAHSGVGSSGPFRGRKRSLYEGGVRVPFLLRWPKGNPSRGKVDDSTPIAAVDLMPTFCSLAGAAIPETRRNPSDPSETAVDGEDMSDVFRGASRERTTPLLWEWRFRVYGHCLNRSPILSIRDGRWKLLFNPDGSRTELYDAPNDPMEYTNLADLHPDVVEKLKERALAWQATLPTGPVDEEAGSNAYPWPGRAPRYGSSGI